MSTPYNGAAASVVGSLPTSKNIASSTNANPIAVTTSAAHGMTTGDKADIKNHQTNTSANGVWSVTVTGANTFTIPVAGVGVGGATGVAVPISLGATYPMPTDGDNDNGASIQPSLEALGDRSAFLGTGTGVAKLAGRISWYYPDTTGVSAWGQANVTAVANTWYPIPQDASVTLQRAFLGIDGCLIQGDVAPPFSIVGVMTGDVIRLSMDANTIAGAATPVLFGLFYCIVAPGGSLPGGTFPAGWTQVPGCSKYTLGTGGSGIAPLHLEGFTPLIATGNMFLQPAVYSLAVTGGSTWTLAGDTVLTVECWRPTAMPQ